MKLIGVQKYFCLQFHNFICLFIWNLRFPFGYLPRVALPSPMHTVLGDIRNSLFLDHPVHQVLYDQVYRLQGAKVKSGKRFKLTFIIFMLLVQKQTTPQKKVLNMYQFSYHVLFVSVLAMVLSEYLKRLKELDLFCPM